MKDDHLHAALAALDRAIEDRPGKVYDDLAQAVRCLVQLRDELIAQRRSHSSGNSLERCNTILSLVVAGEYPLEGVRRDRMRQARQELAALLADCE